MARGRNAGRRGAPVKLLIISASAAIGAVVVALIYLAAEPGPLHPHVILATIFGVGLSVLFAGVLMTLIYWSAASGRDDAVGGTRRPPRD
ncbi:hypothetical protein [Sphingomonas crocodyli]|uniref:Uncharacterized protein n=1 Tax=Sphingomonas crocodyli TaxID=1979270 RepID=A0A437LYD1_9SPHN|nr:hypothetical protein [Sphingomonas crocodyli]RVT90420.1 hypothetical protein EOD43_19370 [Sphingomonas crocodyli]